MERECRVCGCTEDNACEGGCSWVEEDLCSKCVDDEVNQDSENLEESKETELKEPKTIVEDVQTSTVQDANALDKLDREFKGFKGGGIKGVIAPPTLETLKLFCRNSNFAAAVMKNPNTFSDCIEKISKGVGNAISDLEVYQRAAAFYFPGAKISFSMSIDTTGLDIPVMEKEVVANIPKEVNKHQFFNTQKATEAPQEAEKFTIDLDDFI